MNSLDMHGGAPPGPGVGLSLEVCPESDGRHSGGEDVLDDDGSDSGLLRCARCDFETPSRITFVAHLADCNTDNAVDGKILTLFPPLFCVISGR